MIGITLREATKRDIVFMNIANAIKPLSKDESTKLGAVIIGPDNEIRSMGYNSFPRGINDNLPERQQRPHKYYFFEHAERNAIYNSARCGGAGLKGCAIYVEWMPCADCARAIIQSGITTVVICHGELPDRWMESAKASLEMFIESGVTVYAIELV